MTKGHAFEIYSDYEEEIWVQQKKDSANVAILIYIARDVEIFEGSLLPFALLFAQDALSNLG